MHAHCTSHDVDDHYLISDPAKAHLCYNEGHNGEVNKALIGYRVLVGHSTY